MLHEIKTNKGTRQFGKADKMTSNETEISFLNKYFIFKKIKNVDTKAIVLDVTEREDKDDDDDASVGGIIKLNQSNNFILI